MGSSYSTLHHERKCNGADIILTFPSQAIAEAEVAERYPGFRISAVIALNLPDSDESNGIGADDDSFPVQVNLTPIDVDPMPPEIRANTRKFWETCGFGQFRLRQSRVSNGVTTIIDALLEDEVRPIWLERMTLDEWMEKFFMYVYRRTDRQKMYDRFHEELAREPND